MPVPAVNTEFIYGNIASFNVVLRGLDEGYWKSFSLRGDIPQ